jgi:DNA repair exonuclease SbcCD ATPase subunit
MSGGEKSRVTLALLFTLPVLVAPRKRSNMLILDEVDSALDTEGKEILTASVFPSLRNLFSSIFVISHNNDININFFDQTWKIVKTDGVSSIIRSQRESKQ